MRFLARIMALLAAAIALSAPAFAANPPALPRYPDWNETDPGPQPPPFDVDLRIFVPIDFVIMTAAPIADVLPFFPQTICPADFDGEALLFIYIGLGEAYEDGDGGFGFLNELAISVLTDDPSFLQFVIIADFFDGSPEDRARLESAGFRTQLARFRTRVVDRDGRRHLGAAVTLPNGRSILQVELEGPIADLASSFVSSAPIEVVYTTGGAAPLEGAHLGYLEQANLAAPPPDWELEVVRPEVLRLPDGSLHLTAEPTILFVGRDHEYVYERR